MRLSVWSACVVSLSSRRLQVRALVQELLEPELVDLVDDDEQAHGALVTASKCRCALGPSVA